METPTSPEKKIKSTRNIFERFQINKNAVSAQRTLEALGQSIKYQLANPDEAGFSQITTSKSAWTAEKDLSGVHITSITRQENQPKADWDAQKLSYKVRESDIADDQTLVFFLPEDFECTNSESDQTFSEQYKRDVEDTDATLFDMVVDNAGDSYHRDEWKPKKLTAIVAQRKGNTLFTMHVILNDQDEEALITPLNQNPFIDGQALLGQEIYLSPQQAKEKQYFNERYCRMLIMRPSSNEELVSRH